jgi:hypothetical protein
VKAILYLFVFVYLLNLIPAFAPPTWMVFSFLGFRYPLHNVPLFAVVGALAATLGRVTLAKLARLIIRQKFMSQASRDNIDAIRERMEKRRVMTFGVFLSYAFTPLPSNYLFIAYGLTPLELKLIAVPFFLGRSVSYGFWGFTSSAVSRRLTLESTETISYMTVYFVITQILLLLTVYAFTRVDWRLLLTERKMRWLKKRRNSEL